MSGTNSENCSRDSLVGPLLPKFAPIDFPVTLSQCHDLLLFSLSLSQSQAISSSSSSSSTTTSPFSLLAVGISAIFPPVVQTQIWFSKSDLRRRRKGRNLGPWNRFEEMGGCFSKKKKKNPSPANGYLQEKSPALESHTLLQGNPVYAPLSPPTPLTEEETVKEVLPVPENPEPSFCENEPKSSSPTTEEQQENEKEEEKVEEKVQAFMSEDVTSGFSEVCSLSETVSTATIAEKTGEGNGGGDEVEVRRGENRAPARRRRKRSASGDFPARTDKAGKSPARKSDPLPARRPPVREVGRIPTGGGGCRRDRGDNSGTRSRSPGNQKSVGRSTPARVTGRAPARVTDDSGRRTDETEEGGATSSAPKESLENPLVSLECFIFL